MPYFGGIFAQIQTNMKFLRNLDRQFLYLKKFNFMNVTSLHLITLTFPLNWTILEINTCIYVLLTKRHNQLEIYYSSVPLKHLCVQVNLLKMKYVLDIKPCYISRPNKLTLVFLI